MIGCHKKIGDSCGYDFDCSPNMNRNCDRSQPGGYCLILSCTSDQCPDEAVCVEFTTPCPNGPSLELDGGLEYEEACDQMATNRGRSYCLRYCKKDSDCRADYICDDPENLDAMIVDSKHSDRGVCVPDV